MICELGRVLAPGGPICWSRPSNGRSTSSPTITVASLASASIICCSKPDLRSISIQPVGGFFRLLSRRLLNALQFFPGPLMLVAAIFFVPPALVLAAARPAG